MAKRRKVASDYSHPAEPSGEALGEVEKLRPRPPNGQAWLSVALPSGLVDAAVGRARRLGVPLSRVVAEALGAQR